MFESFNDPYSILSCKYVANKFSLIFMIEFKGVLKSWEIDWKYKVLHFSAILCLVMFLKFVISVTNIKASFFYFPPYTLYFMLIFVFVLTILYETSNSISWF